MPQAASSYTPPKQSRLDQGLCIQCGAERTGPGIQARLCACCAEQMREAKRRYRAKHHDDPDFRARTAEHARKTRAAHTALHRCFRCGKPVPLGGGKHCPKCRAVIRARQTQRRQQECNARAGLPPDSPYSWPVRP